MDLTLKRLAIRDRMRLARITNVRLAHALGLSPSNLHRLLSGPSKTERDLSEKLGQIEDSVNAIASGKTP